MTKLFPLSPCLKYSKEWGEYHPGLHTIYVKNEALEYDFPIVWFEEMIHRSCFDYTWLKYRFPFATFERIEEFQKMVNKAKEKGIMLKSPLGKYAGNYPEEICDMLTRITESYKIGDFYLSSIDPFFHALFFRIFENLNKESYSAEEFAEADGQYMNVPEEFRDFVQTISPYKIYENKLIYEEYKIDSFTNHPEIKIAYEKLSGIEKTILNSKDYNRIICYIMNPAIIIPPLLDSPILDDIKESPKYNAQKRFDIVYEIVKNYSSDYHWNSLQKKIEDACQDTFMESLSRPHEIELLLKKYANNIPEKHPTRLFSIDDFNLLVLYPPYIHSTQIEGYDMVFNITLSILNLIEMDSGEFAYIWPKFIDKAAVSRMLQIFIMNNWMESLLEYPNPECLPNKEPDIVDCRHECDTCFITQLGRAFIT